MRCSPTSKVTQVATEPCKKTSMQAVHGHSDPSAPRSSGDVPISENTKQVKLAEPQSSASMPCSDEPNASQPSASDACEPRHIVSAKRANAKQAAESTQVHNVSHDVELVSDACDVSQALGDYDPSAPCWRRAGGPLPYAHVATTLDALERTRSRLLKSTILTNAFRAALALRAPPADVIAAAYLLAPAKDAQT
eukprot:4971217-Pleurochrysis_carterae.AAC.1